MGELVLFPAWSVVTRDEGSAPGDPQALVDPSGKRIPVDEVVKRRLIASSEPLAPVRHEAVVRAGGRLFTLTYTDGDDAWSVRPA